PVRDGELQALRDEHALYDYMQRNLGVRHLRLAHRRPKAIDRFRQRYRRLPHPIPDSLRELALGMLAVRRAPYQEEAARARPASPPPARIPSEFVRDLTRRVRIRGLVQRDQQPRAYWAACE